MKLTYYALLTRCKDESSTNNKQVLLLKGCAKNIFNMEPKERPAAQAFINCLKSRPGKITQWMGKNIEDELLKIFMTGIISKAFSEIQKEELEKE